MVAGVFAAIATLAAAILCGEPFAYYSVCDVCGAMRNTWDWRTPLTELTVFSRSIVNETTLSRVLLTNSIVQPHAHHWLFGQGGGHGVKCAIGPGRHIYPAAESAEFASLVLDLHRRGEIGFRDRVLRGVFDPETSRMFRNLSFHAPQTAMSAAEIRDWITEEFEHLDQMVSANKKR